MNNHPRKKIKRNAHSDHGFTLLEIMIALSILSISLLSFYAAQGNSLRASGRAENIQIASRLARQTMAEKMMLLQKDLNKGKLPADDAEEHEDYPAPFARFRWRLQVRKVELPVIQPGEEPEPESDSNTPTTSEAPAAVPANLQRNMAQQITKKISESIREVSLEVLWDELGEEQSVKVTTHLARLP